MDQTEYTALIPLFEELQGERVLVRPFRPSDAQALYEAVNESRDHLRPWLPFADAHQTVEETQDWIIHQMARWLLRETMSTGLWEKASGRFLGGSELHPRNWKSRHFDIGYWIRASATGHGYMTDTVRLLTEHAFSELAATRVTIHCDERNRRSANMALRLGFVLEARLRNDFLAPDGVLRNTLVFSLTLEDRETVREN